MHTPLLPLLFSLFWLLLGYLVATIHKRRKRHVALVHLQFDLDEMTRRKDRWISKYLSVLDLANNCRAETVLLRQEYDQVCDERQQLRVQVRQLQRVVSRTPLGILEARLQQIHNDQSAL